MFLLAHANPQLNPMLYTQSQISSACSQIQELHKLHGPGAIISPSTISTTGAPVSPVTFSPIKSISLLPTALTDRVWDWDTMHVRRKGGKIEGSRGRVNYDSYLPQNCTVSHPLDRSKTTHMACDFLENWKIATNP